MMTTGKLLRQAGRALFYLGLAALAGIFIIVLVNSTWPAFLKPVQTLFAALTDIVGGFAFVIEGLIFLGPGLALVKLGEALEASAEQKAH